MKLYIQVIILLLVTSLFSACLFEENASTNSSTRTLNADEIAILGSWKSQMGPDATMAGFIGINPGRIYVNFNPDGTFFEWDSARAYPETGTGFNILNHAITGNFTYQDSILTLTNLECAAIDTTNYQTIYIDCNDLNSHVCLKTSPMYTSWLVTETYKGSLSFDTSDELPFEYIHTSIDLKDPTNPENMMCGLWRHNYESPIKQNH